MPISARPLVRMELLATTSNFLSSLLPIFVKFWQWLLPPFFIHIFYSYRRSRNKLKQLFFELLVKFDAYYFETHLHFIAFVIEHFNLLHQTVCSKEKPALFARKSVLADYSRSLAILQR